jgi:hypothetical protein
MKLLVCVKQVPDMESRFKVNSSGDWLSESDIAFRMNEYDEYAVEQAVLLREQLGEGTELTVLSIGPDRVVEPIKKALAMGCDRAVHTHDPDVLRPFGSCVHHCDVRRRQVRCHLYRHAVAGSGFRLVGVTVAELLAMPVRPPWRSNIPRKIKGSVNRG